MLPFLGRLLRRVRPREGWIVFFLAATAALCLPAAAVEGRLIRGLGPTIPLAALGFSIGWWLGDRRWHAAWAAVLGVLGGVLADLVWGVHALALRPLGGQVIRWLVWAAGTREASPPPISFFDDQWRSVLEFGQRVGWWINGVITGHGVEDNLVLVGIVGLVAWGVAFWAGWWLTRRGQPFVALVPTGFLLAQNVYYAERGFAWVAVFLGATTLLMVLVRLDWQMRGWDADDVDYSPEIRLEAGLVAVFMASIALVAAAIALPSPRQISEAFWRGFRDPYEQFETRLEERFPGIEMPRSLVPPGGVAAGGLPRAHLLGGRPELGREVALHVRVRGAAGEERLYWRGQTFAVYNGRGWQPDERRSLISDLAAGQPWTDAAVGRNRHPVLASVEVLAASQAVLYGPGELISADRPYEALVRGPGELISLRASDRADRYSVLGQVADQDPAALRAADGALPDEVADLYLALPEDLPPALRDYAREITAGADTPYDRALAIETALRELPYSLDVPAPPAGQDLVAWFLFDLRRGYCDYYASAMIVLARLSGIPARLAVGYATGSYDPDIEAYVVTELDAHSWPELYFPGYGWIPFEPTAARAVPVRAPSLEKPVIEPQMTETEALDVDAGLVELRQLATAHAAEARRLTWLGGALAVVCGLLFTRSVLQWRARHPGAAGAGIEAAYARLVRWGARLGRPPIPAETPREYAQALAELAAARGGPRAGTSEPLRAAVAVVRAETPRLAQALEEKLYAPELSSGPESPDEARRWQPLWAALRRVWVGRWWG